MRRLGLPTEQIIALHRCNSATAGHFATANRLSHKESENSIRSARNGTSLGFLMHVSVSEVTEKTVQPPGSKSRNK